MNDKTAEIELTVGMTPFSTKPCISLRIGSTHRILARFDNETWEEGRE